MNRRQILYVSWLGVRGEEFKEGTNTKSFFSKFAFLPVLRFHNLVKLTFLCFFYTDRRQGNNFSPVGAGATLRSS